MKFFLVLLVSILISGSSALFVPPPFEYRAAFQVAGPVDGDITSRKADIENSIENILMEIVNGGTGFNYTLGSITLEKLTNGSTSELVVNMNFSTTTKSISDFAAILQSFSIAEMINGSSVTAGDYDECVNNFDQCSDKADCTNTNGSYTCACIDSFYDSSTNGVPGTTCEVPFSVECYSDRAKVTAIKAYFDSINIYVSDLKFGSCNGSDNGTYLIYEGLCDATITQPNSTNTMLQWNFTNTASTSDLNIGFSFRYPVTCIFESDLTANVSFNATQEEIGADPPANSIDGGNQVAEATFTLRVTKGGNGLGSVVAGPVETSQDLSFELSSPRLLQNSKLVIESVTSSPAENPNQKLNLISSGCLETRTTANAAIIDKSVATGNGMSSTVLFKTPAHSFRGSSVTTMSFSLRICISTGGVSCQPGCSKRKRSVLTWKTKREATTADRGVIEYSFSRDPNEQVCQKDCGEASSCILDSLRNELCICPVGYDIVNGKCAAIPGYNFGSESTDSTATVDADKTMLYILIGLACVLVTLIAVLVVIVFKKRVTTVKINP